MTPFINSRHASRLAATTILIVEDSVFMQDLLHACLMAFDVRKIIKVKTPMECVNEMLDQPIDALIVDWCLEEYDGLKLVRKIRRDMPDPLCRIPIVLCTAYSDLARVIEARNSGVNEMLCKPVAPIGLYSKLSSALMSDREFMVTETYVGPARRMPQPDRTDNLKPGVVAAREANSQTALADRRPN